MISHFTICLILVFGASLPSTLGFENLGTFQYVGHNGQMIESTYHLGPGRGWWNTTEKLCVEEGLGKLLSIETKEEDEIIQNLIKLKSTPFFTSGTFENGIWKWASTGEPIVYQNWRQDHPKDGTQYRLVVYTNTADYSYGWWSWAWSASTGYICEQTSQL